MKNFIALFLLISTFSYSQQTNEVQPYLSEIITEFPNVRDITIAKNGNEIYFSVQSYMAELSTIVVVKKEITGWSKPQVVSFSGQFHDLEPFLSPNGLRLYFASNRPLNSNETEIRDFDIWYVERKSPNDKWSKPINIGAPINTDKNEFYPAITNNNNIYFTSDWESTKGKDDIFMSKYENGKYNEPISLSSTINSEGYEFNAYVSPDDSIMIYTAYNRKDGLGSGDLYMSEKDENDRWTKSKNLGSSVNSNKMDYCPFFEPTTNTLYFTSKRNSTKSKFTDKKSLNQFLKEVNKYENGLSRLYKTTIKN